MTDPLSDLYLRDCRERLESSEHMDPIEWAERAPSLLGEIERLRAEVDRLTKERDEAVTCSYVERWLRYDVAALRAEMESLAPHARDTETEPDAEVLTSPHRCDCCSTVIEPGDSAVMFIDEAGRECWAHYGPCPEPEMWCVEFAAPLGWIRLRDHALPYEDALPRARKILGTLLTRVRLVRCKEPSRG